MRSTRKAILRNREYDPFADLYNRFWGKEYRAAAIPIVDRLLLSRLPAEASLLDVCCGTGQFAAAWLERAYAVTGIDSSASMIRHARRNAPSGKFIVADVREFELGQQFDAAASVFESLNHLPDAEGLTRAFTSVRKHLMPGAPFLFDLVGPSTYRHNWNASHSIVRDDVICGVRLSFDESTGTGTCKITAIERSPVARRRDFTLHQHCHTDAVVTAALDMAGFSRPTLYAAQDPGMPASLGIDRTFWLVSA